MGGKDTTRVYNWEHNVGLFTRIVCSFQNEILQWLLLIKLLLSPSSYMAVNENYELYTKKR